MAGGQPREQGVVLLQERIREAAPGSAQQKKQFAGPEKNVQQASALQVVDVLAVQCYFKSPPRTLLDECPQIREVERNASDSLGPWIDALQIFVTEIDEVIQAKILLSQ